jgi:hypothetical protein
LNELYSRHSPYDALAERWVKDNELDKLFTKLPPDVRFDMLALCKTSFIAGACHGAQLTYDEILNRGTSHGTT